MKRRRVAIIISGNGSNMDRLLEDMEDPLHPGEACLVISNNPNAGGLLKASARKVAAVCVDHRQYSERPLFEAEMQSQLQKHGADIICLAGFMRVLTAGFVAAWSGRILNIHPSILPMFPGLHTHARALDAGMAVHGCTVHEVIPELDAGPILGQAVVRIVDGDTEERLARRVNNVEHALYPAVLRRFAAGIREKVSILSSTA